MDIVSQTLKKQKKFDKHVPSNWDPKSNSIHLSESEFKELVKGGSVSLNCLLPMILWDMGVSLKKREYPQEELTEE